MKTIKILSLLVCLCVSLTSYAQRNDLLLTNSQSVEKNLYEGIEGSPFYFDNWQKGEIFPKNESEAIEKVWLNYNGYTKNFEVKKDNRYITLDENWYKRVEITPKNQGKLIFETNLLPKQTKQFVQLIYQGTNFYILQDFKVSLIKTEKVRNFGNIKVQSFASKQMYYFVTNGKANYFKLKKKSILSILPQYKSEVEKYLKTNRIKFNEKTDLVKVMTYYEELTRPSTLVNAGEKQ